MNYLAALIERALGTAFSIRPRVPTAYEPAPGRPLREPFADRLAAEPLAESVDGSQEQAVRIIPPAAAPIRGPAADATPAPVTSARPPTRPLSSGERLNPVLPSDTTRRPAGSLADAFREAPPSADPALASVPGDPVWPSGAAQDMGRMARSRADEGTSVSLPEVRPRSELQTAPAGHSVAAPAPPRIAQPARIDPSAAPARAASADVATVHIRIGRVEVRALLQPGPGTPAPSARPAPRRQPLEEYLAGRGGRP